MFYRDEGMDKLPCTPISSVIPFGTNVANMSFSSLNFTCALMATVQTRSSVFIPNRQIGTMQTHQQQDQSRRMQTRERGIRDGRFCSSWTVVEGRGEGWTSQKVVLRVSMCLYTLANFHFSSPLWFHGQQFNCDDMYDAGHSPSSSATWHI